MAASQVLPPKEQSLFKQIVKFYEEKQYKKGIKTADTILKKYPEHGETLSMKGLILNSMNEKTEAYDLVKKGLRCDLRSHVCWHVFGLLYRSDRNYAEAIKCYRNALRIDKDNLQILRDLAMLQVHIRDNAGLKETRRQLLTLKPHKANFIGFAISLHLCNNLKQAADVLSKYEATVTDPVADFETSEILLYKTMILEEAGDFEAAYDVLVSKEKFILDKLSMMEQKVSLLLKLNRKDEAETILKRLLKMNPDNTLYHRSLQQAKGFDIPVGPCRLDSSTEEALLALYDDMTKEFPRSYGFSRLPLDFSTGPRFISRFDRYVRQALRKGIPSLFSDLKALYSDSDKVSAIESLFLSYVSSLESNHSFPPAPDASSSSEAPARESPAVILWVYFFLAQHFTRLRQTNRALEFIDKAIAHTPTVIDLYVVKARIYKHAGNVQLAADLMDEARSMDLADRYLNTKSTLYLIRADRLEQADNTVALFTREGENQQSNLHEMQCIWYETEMGLSHWRQQQHGKALKKLKAIEKHFSDFVEDQFDFHSYCLRKMTLRAYIKTLRMEDRVHSHRFFFKAATSAVQTYLDIYDTPQVDSSSSVEVDLESLSLEDRKKLKAKKKFEEAKARKKAELEAKQKEEEDKKKAAGKGKKDTPVDTDPEGLTLSKPEEALTNATNLIKTLTRYANDRFLTHQLAFDVYLRRQKYLLVLQALRRMRDISPNHPELHTRSVVFFKQVDTLLASNTLPAPVAEVIAAERSEWLQSRSLLQVCEEYQQHATDVPSRRAAGEAFFLLDSSFKSRALPLLTDLSGAHSYHKECVAVHKFLLEKVQDAEAAEKYKVSCQSVFPYSSHFGAVLPSPQTDSQLKEEVSV